jgi:HlyD family secretion protein
MMRKFVLLIPLLLCACSKSDDNAWLGYGEGDNVYVSAPSPGWVTGMKVERGTAVHPGQLLFQLDDTHEAAARDQATATIAQDTALIAQEEANLTYAQKSLSRQQGLARVRAGVPTTLDQAEAGYRQSQAHIEQLQSQRQQAQAALNDANYQLSQRSVIARTQGNIQDIYFRNGEYAPASTPVLSILPPENIYVRFFVPETQLANVHLGEKVHVSCDGCAKNITATITFIAQLEEFTPPIIFSVNNREKLVFKLEARAPGGIKLNPGQPVDVRPL